MAILDRKTSDADKLKIIENHVFIGSTSDLIFDDEVKSQLRLSQQI
jgi:hypothetical protein